MTYGQNRAEKRWVKKQNTPEDLEDEVDLGGLKAEEFLFCLCDERERELEEEEIALGEVRLEEGEWGGVGGRGVGGRGRMGVGWG